MEPAATDIEMAMFDDRDKRIVTDMVWRNFWVWTFCYRDGNSERKVQQIADKVWRKCSAMNATANNERSQMTCLTELEDSPDYKEAVSFIPVWLIGIVLQVIIKLLIEYFLAKTGRGKWQTNPS